MGTVTDFFGDRVAPDGRLVKDKFKRWFKDSAVVDDAGNPLVVYHGTLADFASFQLGKGEAQSKAFFFTTQEHVNGYLWSYLDSIKHQEIERPGNHFVMPIFLSIQNPMRVDTTETGEWADPESENASIATAKALGHDGLVFTDGEHETVFYVAFKAEQVKSAIGNSGLYALNSNSLCDPIVSRPDLQLQKALAARQWLTEKSAEQIARPTA